ncbi:MAG TPA: GlsB/YeaQ/YmgE family stress response membrane protein [Ktedonobacteraceae bacterium]|nr:GlsB/YeaQ/YmgE family stress response membrane protein [Ktedonobacteraceae bacterium]
MFTSPALVLGFAFSPTGLIIWLIIGLIAGFIASRIMGGGGYGIIGDVIVGLIGAFIGGFLMNIFMPSANTGFIGSIIVAIIGAIILIAIWRLVTRGASRRGI